MDWYRLPYTGRRRTTGFSTGCARYASDTGRVRPAGCAAGAGAVRCARAGRESAGTFNAGNASSGIASCSTVWVTGSRATTTTGAAYALENVRQHASATVLTTAG